MTMKETGTRRPAAPLVECNVLTVINLFINRYAGIVGAIDMGQMYLVILGGGLLVFAALVGAGELVSHTDGQTGQDTVDTVSTVDDNGSSAGDVGANDTSDGNDGNVSGDRAVTDDGTGVYVVSQGGEEHRVRPVKGNISVDRLVALLEDRESR